MKNLYLKGKVKLSTLLTGLVSLSIVFTTIILLFSSYQSEKESLINTYLSLNYSKSTKISRSVDSLFKSMRKSLENTANFLAQKEGMTDKDIQEQLEVLRMNSQYFNSLSWIDETGYIRNIAPISVGLKGQTISNDETRRAIDLKKPFLSPPYTGPTGRLVVVMSQPFYDKNGTYKGIIGGTIYLQERNVLNEIMGNDIIEDNGSYYYVVGPKGNLIFHPEVKRLGESVESNLIVQKIMKGESGSGQITNTQGVAMLAAASFIPETGWGVIQQTPVLFVNELLHEHIQKLVLYTFPPFVIILIVSIFIAQRLARPFHQLANLVNQLGSGNEVVLTETQSHWNREADLLLRSVMMASEVVQKNQVDLKQAAITDPLTGIPNRRLLDEITENWSQHGRTFTLIGIDIDHFKQVNDTYGHQAGDEVLKFLVYIIQSKTRRTDLFFRYGGEEFILLLPDTIALEAYTIVEKIRTTVETTNSPIGKPITISIGMAEFPLHSNSLNKLFGLADKALYQSKSDGRNRTTIWSSE